MTNEEEQEGSRSVALGVGPPWLAVSMIRCKG